jgi:hypothetical protein
LYLGDASKRYFVPLDRLDVSHRYITIVCAVLRHRKPATRIRMAGRLS